MMEAKNNFTRSSVNQRTAIGVRELVRDFVTLSRDGSDESNFTESPANERAARSISTIGRPVSSNTSRSQ